MSKGGKMWRFKYCSGNCLTEEGRRWLTIMTNDLSQCLQKISVSDISFRATEDNYFSSKIGFFLYVNDHQAKDNYRFDLAAWIINKDGSRKKYIKEDFYEMIREIMSKRNLKISPRRANIIGHYANKITDENYLL